jgi:hypothetical protein
VVTASGSRAPGLSAFEMVRRGFWEARETAALERRHAEVLRRLSGFLADASLALDASDSLEEILRLVAEQARELIGAECCVASAALGPEPSFFEAASYPEGEGEWREFLDAADLSTVFRLIHRAGRPARVSRRELDRDLAFRALSSKFRALAGDDRENRSLRGWLAAPLTTLDGREVGSIQLLDKPEGDFTELDEAVLVPLRADGLGGGRADVALRAGRSVVSAGGRDLDRQVLLHHR